MNIDDLEVVPTSDSGEEENFEEWCLAFIKKRAELAAQSAAVPIVNSRLSPSRTQRSADERSPPRKRIKLSPLPPDESHQPPENRNAATPHATTMNLLPTPNIRAGSPGDLSPESITRNNHVPPAPDYVPALVPQADNPFQDPYPVAGPPLTGLHRISSAGELSMSPPSTLPLPTPEPQGGDTFPEIADDTLPDDGPESQSTIHSIPSATPKTSIQSILPTSHTPSSARIEGPLPNPATLFTPPHSPVLIPSSVTPRTPSARSLRRSQSSSPLTPPTSDKNQSPRRAPSQPSSGVSPTNLNQAQPTEQPDPVEGRSRYPFRQRYPINVKPYQLDQALYKQQLRSNPDAIVEPRSPSRRRRKSPGLPTSGTEPADEREASVSSGASDGERNRKRKGKERAREDHQHPDPIEDVDVPPSILRDIQSVKQPRRYPAAFQDDFSTTGSEDDQNLMPPISSETRDRKKRKRRRTRAFPMKSNESNELSSPKKDRIPSPERLPSLPASTSVKINHDPPKGPQLAQRGPLFRSQSLPSLGEQWDPGDVADASEIPAPAVASDVFPSSQMDLPPTSSSVPDLTRLSPSPPAESVVLDDETSESSVDPREAILRRLYPPRMVEQMMEKSLDRPPRSRKKKPPHDDDSGPLQPGQTRVRRVAVPHVEREIHGDTESSDAEQPPSRSQSVGSQHSVISIPSGSDGNESSDIQQVNAGDWDFAEEFSREGEAEEMDHIDFMLSRTNTGQRRNSGRRRQGRKRGRNATTRIITGGARRYGPKRQTTLPFVRHSGPSRRPSHVTQVRRTIPLSNGGDRNDNTEDATETHIEEHQISETEGQEESRQLRRKQGRNVAGLHVFTFNQHHIVSGRAHPSGVTIDVEAEGPMASSSRPSGVLNRRCHRNPPVGKRSIMERTISRLEDFWLPDSQDPEVGNDVPRSNRPPQHRSSTTPSRQSIDFDVPLLPPGIRFSATTFLGRGYLNELLSLGQSLQDPFRPPPLTAFQSDFSTFSSTSVFTETFGKVGDILLSAIPDPSSGDRLGTRQGWERDFHSISQHVSWYLVHSDPDDLSLLSDTIMNFLLRVDDIVEEQWTSQTNPVRTHDPLVIEVLWFAVELSLRSQGSPRPADLNRTTFLLVRTMWDLGLETVIESVTMQDEQALDSSSTPQRVAEIWICLIHLAQSPSVQSNIRTHLLWDSLQSLLKSIYDQRDVNELEVGRRTWQGIFGLCALSQFTVHGMVTSIPRLEPSWETVASVLKHAPLADTRPAEEGALRRPGAIRKRDRYIRLLVSRCMLLNTRWRWRLEKAAQMFTTLHTVYKSRHFANLSDESSDLPSFLRKNNIELLLDHKRSDTAFTLFLKLVVRAAKEASPPEQADITLTPMVKKFLSLAIPVGAVPFTKTSPPTAPELSMLYNRFSAIAVALYLEPGQWEKLLDRVRHHYLNFTDADMESRRACIRGAMALTILLQHLKVSLSGALAWMNDMTNVLVDEYRSATAPTPSAKSSPLADKDNAILCIRMVLRSIQKIVKTPLMRSENSSPAYPDPSLLQGSWVTRVFSTETDLTTIPETGVEVRSLVQTFLDARTAIMPKPPRPPIATLANEESQESQEDYWSFDQYMDDPELLLGTGAKLPEEVEKRDKTLAEVVDAHISPAIYRLVCRQFNSLKDQKGPITNLDELGRWVDCWVGCANVVVYNQRRDWSLYLNLGRQSWQGIHDPNTRRQVGLLFMLKMLQLDPMSYPDHQERFLEVLFESFATPRVTREHEYTSLVFSIDGLRQQCLQELPCERPHALADFKLTKTGFLEQRAIWVEHIFSRIVVALELDDRSRAEYTRQVQISITCVISFLAAMRDHHEQMPPDNPDCKEYATFCARISESLRMHPILWDHTRLQHSIRWLEDVSVE